MRPFVVVAAFAVAIAVWPASVRADVDGGDGGDAAIEDAAASDSSVEDAATMDAATTDASTEDASMDACTTPCTCVPCTTRPDTGDDEVLGEPDTAASGGCSCETQGTSSPLASAWLVAVIAVVLRARTRRRS
jgi:MYXO-CTERM domain-containing protein